MKRFWSRVSGVMAVGIPRWMEAQTAWPAMGRAGSEDARLIASFIARFVSSLGRTIGSQSSTVRSIAERVGSEPYRDAASRTALSRDVARLAGGVMADVHADLFPPSLGFGNDPEVRVSPSAGGSDLPGASGSIGLQIDINPRGDRPGPIGRVNVDVHLGEDGEAKGASIGWRCRF
jgi:hypothetical protein